MSLALGLRVDVTLGLVLHDLKTLLEPFGLRYFSTDGWDALHVSPRRCTAHRQQTLHAENGAQALGVTDTHRTLSAHDHLGVKAISGMIALSRLHHTGLECM